MKHIYFDPHLLDRLFKESYQRDVHVLELVDSNGLSGQCNNAE